MRKTFALTVSALLSVAAIFLSSRVVISQSQYGKPGKKPAKLTQTLGIDRPFWAPNRIGDYITNDGQLVSHIPARSAGMEWPVGSHNTINYASGLWLAGKKDGEIVTAVAEYVSEFQPGNVTGHAPGVNGSPANPNDPRFKVYLFDKRDLANSDYPNWPVADGAPLNAEGKPLLLGTSTAWAVFNDFNDSLHTLKFKTKRMGVEVQMTAWAFDRRDAFGDMMFFNFKLINKSGRNITDAYVAFWADIDIGDAADLAGCDTSLALGYMYKTQRDGLYGDKPPAIGYVFLQSPIVPLPGDTAMVSGRRIPGFKHLPMTSFQRFISGGPAQFREAEIGEEAYNYMRGFDRVGDPIIDPTTGRATRFWHTGDPVAGIGWLDDIHGDKRFLMSSGPFALADGDAQEVAMGIVIAQGAGGRQSVQLLKNNAAGVKKVYHNNFKTPISPPAPLLMAYPDTNAILLTWNDVAESYSSLDGVSFDNSGNVTGYAFQGYNVYQLEAPAITAVTRIKKIAGFDVIDGVVRIRDDVYSEELGQIMNVVVQDARDTGLQRFFRIAKDALNDDTPLRRNQPYYFAVSAYGYNPFGFPKTLESPLRIITARPQTPPLGTRLTTPTGDSLEVTHLGGSEGQVFATVLSPAALTGHTYEVRFRNTNAGTVYDVWDVTTNVRIDSSHTNQGDGGFWDYPVVDGVLIRVIGTAQGFQNFLCVANAAGRLDPPEYAAFAFSASGFPHPTTGDRPTARQQVGPGLWGFQTGEVDGNFSYDFFLSQVAPGDSFGRLRGHDFEMRFTHAGGYAYTAFSSRHLVAVPFELWNIGNNTPNDPSDDYRMIPWIKDLDGNDAFNLVAVDHSVSGSDNDPETDWIYWMNPQITAPGTAGYDKFVADGLAGTYDGNSPEVMAAIVLVNYNGGSVSDPAFPANVNQIMPEVGTVFRIISNKPNTPADVFRFTTPAQVKNDLALARQQAAALVNVFPNPYRRNIINLDHPGDRFVTFTHLPESFTKILIYTIAGDFVRRLEHTNGTQYEQWDLRNSAGRQVGSGIYLVYIDMGEIGKKVLKVAVF